MNVGKINIGKATAGKTTVEMCSQFNAYFLVAGASFL
jgi:hypothetical protein